ncbi:UDP-2,3-diacylglucosamine diphosphatase [Tautonia sociabilis]|uniref:UDP-2,3-diacylglucosamine diphosphatase n=1 Tax=Tautonia sociabilis TaxID=2080755 RepID=A0A432MN23_9BACT|nr:UDP-2,3-diacylglucosamine diphosphatase [Tautonia sociabilis]RUL88506.1 UDP-2,3-diacylglucosamine diphosphatase [Tautonia sociabilis]
MTDVRPDDPDDRERPYDCLVISDLHLGSDVCQARLLEEFLEWAVRHTRELVINGDIFDDLNFNRLGKRHFACLKAIRRHSDRDDLRLTWIRGNHDGAADVISHIVGVDFLDEYIFDNGQVRLLILHGDQFDHFITRYKWMTSVACGLFYYIQKWMPHSAARWIRRISKRFQRNSQVVRDGAVEYARSLGCDHVTCGHTHAPLEAFIDGVNYVNSGTWTEHPPCPFVTISGARVGLEYWPRATPEPLPPREAGLASASSAEPGRE